jgi:aryl-alcohol dehydrogenase-like predicted oxidoreductase
VKYRRLGHSGLEVSEISLGSWLTIGGSVQDHSSADIIHRAYALGINLFDTANGYNEGRAEELLGQELLRYDRRRLVIATKVYWDTLGGPNFLGLSRKHILESCDASLKRLQTDYIDLFQCHNIDRHTPLRETLQALDDLQGRGKILYAGVSNWSADLVDEAQALAKRHGFRPLISHQPCYNLITRGIEKDLMPACERAGWGWIIYSPLAQGILTGKYVGAKSTKGTRAADSKRNQWIKPLLTPKNMERVKGLMALAKAKRCSAGQLALAWCLSRPIVASAIIGASSVAQLEENVAAATLHLDAKSLAAIEALFPLEGVA